MKPHVKEGLEFAFITIVMIAGFAITWWFVFSVAAWDFGASDTHLRLVFAPAIVGGIDGFIYGVCEYWKRGY